jgi:hypothetical protein
MPQMSCNLAKDKAMHKIKTNIPIIYLFVLLKFREKGKKCYSFPVMKTKDVLEILKIAIRLPRKMKYAVLGEMETFGLLKRINHQSYTLNDSDKINKLLKQLRPYFEEQEFEFW